MNKLVKRAQTIREGSLIKLADQGPVGEPLYLTLASIPANQKPFKVIRADDVAPRKVRVTKRVNRSDSPLVAIQFPTTFTRDECEAALTQFGLSDYEIRDGDSGFIAMRSDLASLPQGISSIKLRSDGTNAFVLRQQKSDAAGTPTGNNRLTVTQLIFVKSAFDSSDAVQSWLDAHGIETDSIHDEEILYVVNRSDAGKEETRQCAVDEGVTAVVRRSDIQDVPVALARVVDESMYGNYGWGHLDFNAALADVEFSEAADESIDMLRSVLYRILLHSPLTNAVRKDLMANAVTQFQEYMVSLVDALPATVVVALRTDTRKSSTEAEMSKDDKDQSKDQGTPNVAVLTREDVAAIVKETLVVALPEALKVVQNADSAPAATDAPKGNDELLKNLIEQQKQMTDVIAKLGETVKSMGERTVVRADGGDDAGEPARKRTKDGMFQGVLGQAFSVGKA